MDIIVISQIQRSGGTLLSQLFDGHPEIMSYPHECYLSFNGEPIWPDSSFKATKGIVEKKREKELPEDTPGWQQALEIYNNIRESYAV